MDPKQGRGRPSEDYNCCSSVLYYAYIQSKISLNVHKININLRTITKGWQYAPNTQGGQGERGNFMEKMP